MKLDVGHRVDLWNRLGNPCWCGLRDGTVASLSGTIWILICPRLRLNFELGVKDPIKEYLHALHNV